MRERDIYKLVERYVTEFFPDLEGEARQQRIEALCASFMNV